MSFRSLSVYLALALLFTAYTSKNSPAAELRPAPLPAKVIELAPGMRPLGKGRHTWFGVHIYDATLWVVGDRWTPDQPHAIDLESGRDVPANTLVGAAIDEMRKLKMGDEAQLKLWSDEMKRLLPPVRRGDQVVLFCSSGRTVIAYYNGQERGEINDPSFSSALFKVWLDPRAKNPQLRKSLLNE